MPVTNEAKEFDAQVQAMAKMVGDSINVQAIKKHSGLRIDGDAVKGSLDLLEAWLKHLKVPEESIRQVMGPLRLLQQLRSQGAAHRRGSEYLILLKRNGLDALDTGERVRRVMDATTKALSDLGVLLDAI